jgi:membrane peptidoglycan carboxypeptidase
VYAREQVGSSFKPYVLAQAVMEQMNVKTSTLNGNSPLWVPPDYPADRLKLSTTNTAQKLPGAFQFNNDSNEKLGPLTVQNAFAQSSNTAFTDLAHRVGTQNIISLAQEMGVNTQSYPNGSGLGSMVGQVGLALGTAALTINEQDTMLATIDNGGIYHQAHAVESIAAQGGTAQRGKYDTHQVLTTAQASQVQYAMSTVVTPGGHGTAAGMIDQASMRPIIAKTGTTTSNKTAFFIGAIPQDALTVGIFTKDQSQSSTETLNNLGGTAQGGFGGYWPAKIWNTFADAKFASLPVQQFLPAQFSGQTWNQVPKPPAKPKKPNNNNQNCQSQGGQGGGISCPGGGSKRCKRFSCPGGGPTTPPTVPTSPSTGCLFPGAPGCPTNSPTTNPTGSTTPTPTGTATGGGKGNGGVTQGVTTAAVTSDATPGVQVSLALGGVLSVLPGSLLWNRASRRRRRKRGAGR